MNTIQLRILDETGQKSDDVTVTSDTCWAEVGTLAIQRLDLPAMVGAEPMFYHLFDDTSGESLLPYVSVDETVCGLEDRFLVRIATEMQPA